MTDPTPFRPGGLVSAESVPTRLDDEECVLVVREGVGVMCVRDHTHPGDDDEFAPYLAEQLRDPEVKAAYDMEMGSAAGQARRRWWHRLTRALAGRWLHVLTPGFLGELFNDIWSHTRHRLTRRNP